LAVECDGDHWHGVDQYEADMQRQRMLERCGWEFFRVRESSFYLNHQEALRGLWNLLEERGVLARWSTNMSITPSEAELDAPCHAATSSESGSSESTSLASV
jgi:hypothetical protein